MSSVFKLVATPIFSTCLSLILAANWSQAESVRASGVSSIAPTGSSSGACYPGFADDIKTLRAAQRSYACMQAGTVTGCEIAMGIGVVGGAIAAASQMGKSSLGKSVAKVRDEGFRLCTLRASNLHFFWLRPMSAFADVNPAIKCLNVKDQVSGILDQLEEYQKGLLNGSRALSSELPDLDKEMKGITDPNARAAKLRELQAKAEATVKAARNSAEAQMKKAFPHMLEWEGDMIEAENAARQYLKMFPEWVRKEFRADGVTEANWRGLNAGSLNDLQRYYGMTDAEVRKLEGAFKEFKVIAERGQESFNSIQKAKASLEFSQLDRLNADLGDKFKKLQRMSAAEFEVAVKEGREASVRVVSGLEANLAEIAKLKARVAAPGVSTAEMERIANILNKFVPQKLARFGSIDAVAATDVGQIQGELRAFANAGHYSSDAVHSLLKNADRIEKATLAGAEAVAGRAGGMVAIRGALAFLGSAGVALGAHAGELGTVCDGVTNSVSKPFGSGDKLVECARAGLENPYLQKAVDLPEAELCSLLRSDPDNMTGWKALTADLRSKYLVNSKLTCGPPATISVPGRGTAVWNQSAGTVVYTADDRTKYKEPITVKYSNDGTAIMWATGKLDPVTRKPKYLAVTDQGYNPSGMSEVRTNLNWILPGLNEGRSCCPGNEGTSPSAAECSERYGITQASASGRSGSPTSSSHRVNN